MKPPNPLSAPRCCDHVSSVLGRRAVAAALQSTQQPAAQWRRSSVAHLAATQQPVARCAFPVHARSQCLCTLSHTERGHLYPRMSMLDPAAAVRTFLPSVDTCISRCTCTHVHARPIRLCTQTHTERGHLYPRMSTLDCSASLPNMMPSVDTLYPRLCMSTLDCSASVPNMMPSMDTSTLACPRSTAPPLYPT
jgi:hypothetical protein